MIVDEGIYLKHFGTKGMRWGVRKAPSPQKQARREEKAKRYEKHSKSTQGKIDRLDLKTPKTQRGRDSQALTRANLVKIKEKADKDANLKRDGKLTFEEKKALAVTAAVVGLFVASKLDAKMNSIPAPKMSAPKTKSAEDLIRNTQKTQMSSLTRMFNEGKMDEAQYETFSKTLNARFDRKVAEAFLREDY